MIKKLVSKKGQWISTVASFAGSIVVLAILWKKIDLRWDKLEEQWLRADKVILAFTILVSLAFHIVVGADKWYRVLKRLHAPVGWWEVLGVRMGSDPIRFAAPFKTGEFINAAYFYQKGYLDFPHSLSSILFDKVLNFLGTVFWLFVGLGLIGMSQIEWDVSILKRLVIMLAVGASFITLLVYEPARALLAEIGGRIHPKARKLLDGGLAPFRIMTMRQKLFFLLYGIFFLLRPLIVLYLLFRTFHVSPSINEVIAYGSIAVLMSNVPLTHAGIGPREAAIVYLFSAYGDRSMLMSVGLLMSFSIHIAPAIVGIPMAPRLLRAMVDAVSGHAEQAVGQENGEEDAARIQDDRERGVLAAGDVPQK